MSGIEVARLGRGEPEYPERIVRAHGDDAPPRMSIMSNADLLRGPLLALFCTIQYPRNLILGVSGVAVPPAVRAHHEVSNQGDAVRFTVGHMGAPAVAVL